LFYAWLCGFLIVAFAWARQWQRVRTAVRTASPLHLNLPIRAVSSPARLEPGVFGIFRPILLLPDGITERLTPMQWQAILAHELCHVRRRDNLTAAIHMAIEAIFWFHPLVWWIGKRMVDERERACDEEVTLAVGDPEAYAEGILNVCRIYLESPLACVSGVTGSGVNGSHLRKRVRAIMTQRKADNLGSGRKLLLAAAGLAAIGGPILFGLANAPQSKAQSQAAAVSRPAFEVASIKLNTTTNTPGWARFEPAGIDIRRAALLEVIATAYRVPDSLVSADPRMRDLFASRYDIVAKAEHEVPRDQLLAMLQTLLADRFRLTLHRESKVQPVYKLVIAKGGSKLRESQGPQPRDPNCTFPKHVCFRIGTGKPNGSPGAGSHRTSGLVRFHFAAGQYGRADRQRSRRSRAETKDVGLVSVFDLHRYREATWVATGIGQGAGGDPCDRSYGTALRELGLAPEKSLDVTN
jgi:hypothetical protein